MALEGEGNPLLFHLAESWKVIPCATTLKNVSQIEQKWTPLHYSQCESSGGLESCHHGNSLLGLDLRFGELNIKKENAD
jgi:hypothetical protein